MKSKKYYIDGHKKLWSWLANYPMANKKDWSKWKMNGGSYPMAKDNCFACEYATKRMDLSKNKNQTQNMCDFCLFEWPGGSCAWEVNKSLLFEEWITEKRPKIRAELALQIANLPLRKEKKIMDKDAYEYKEWEVPPYMRDGIERYVENGIKPGSFLCKIFENNLVDAVFYADDENINELPAYANLLYNHVPSFCWGNKNKVKAWIKKGGRNG